jgi:hypothetical protein
MSNNRSGNRNHQKNRKFICAICGGVGYTTPARHAIAKYCSDKCRAESLRIGQRERYERARGGPKIGGPWKIIEDPGKTWGQNSSFDLNEIKTLCRLNYLDPGTCFKNDKQKAEYEVVKAGFGKLELRRL